MFTLFKLIYANILMCTVNSFATLTDIIYSNADSVTLDPEVRALVSNVKPASRTVWDLHRDGPAITTVTYDTYTRPNRARAGVIGDGAGTGWADGVATTSLPMTAGAVAILDIGYVIKVESEIVVVKAVNRTANTIDVYGRGAGGTTGAAHADTTAFLVHTVAIPEGTNPGEGLFDETVKSSNGIQLINRKIKATYTEAKQRRKTIENLIALREQEEIIRVIEDLDYSSIYGYYDAGDNGNKPRLTRGLIQSIVLSGDSDLVINVGGAFTETVMTNTLQKIWEKKGSITHIVVSPANKKIINGFGSFQSRTAGVTGNVVGQVIDTVYADGVGTVQVVVDHNLGSDTVIYCNANDMEKGWFVDDMLRIEDTSDPENPRQVIETIHGQFGFNYENLKSNFALNINIT